MNKKIFSAIFIAAIFAFAVYFIVSPKNDSYVDTGNETISTPKGKSEPKESTDTRLQAHSIEASNNTKPFEDIPFALAKSRALSGDQESQLLLSKMYDYCFLYNLNPHATLAQLSEMGNADPKCGVRVGKIKEELTAKCASVDDGKPIPAEAVTLWIEQSAKQGQLTAQIRHAVYSQEKDEKRLLSYVATLRANPRLDAVFEMGALSRLVEPYWKDANTKAAFSESGYSEYAWQLAACRAGLDCTATSLNTSAMVFQGGCSYDNYEQYILDQAVSPQGRKNLEETIAIIQREFLSKKAR